MRRHRLLTFVLLVCLMAGLAVAWLRPTGQPLLKAAGPSSAEASTPAAEPYVPAAERAEAAAHPAKPAEPDSLPWAERRSYARPATALEQSIERQGFVDLQSVDPTIGVSLMYGRADNFTGRVLYADLHRAYLHPEAAQALSRAQAALRRERPELSLLVMDAGRPMRVQQAMWDAVAGTPLYFYVSNPSRGGGLHNYGLAVDVTLCLAATGDTLPMGSLVDHMSPLSHPREEERLLRQGCLGAEAHANRLLLRRVMHEAGFSVLPTEWWHFNLRSRAEARRRYAVIR